MIISCLSSFLCPSQKMLVLWKAPSASEHLFIAFTFTSCLHLQSVSCAVKGCSGDASYGCTIKAGLLLVNFNFAGEFLTSSTNQFGDPDGTLSAHLQDPKSQRFNFPLHVGFVGFFENTRAHTGPQKTSLLVKRLSILEEISLGDEASCF